MPDNNHEKWIDILSVGTTVNKQVNDASNTLETSGVGGKSVAPPLSPEIPSLAVSQGPSDSFDFVVLDKSEEDPQAAIEPTKVLVSSVYIGGSNPRAVDEDPLHEVPEGNLAPVDGFDFF